MKIKEPIRYYYVALRNQMKYYKYAKRYNNNLLDVYSAELIRNIHSIEKGLSLEKPRDMFGQKKICEIMKLVEKLTNSNKYDEVIKMAIDVLREYLLYHRNKKIKEDFLDKIESFISEYKSKSDIKYGGTITFNKKELNYKIEDIEKFFKSRHSIRDFDHSEVDLDKLKKAISLAQTAPSACNRQGVRLYIIDGKKSNSLSGWMTGVGGFAENVSKFIIVTGKVSSYSQFETGQYIVSSAIFAAYLSLTIHLYGMGTCICQRDVYWGKGWEKIRKQYNIPKDEQVVCVLCVGNLKESCKVPVSHRLNIDEISKIL